MHVILDSNIYVSDFGMSGVLFESLFDYLKKTDSQLVIPQVVWDEILAKYLQTLKDRIRAAKSSLSSLNAILFTATASTVREIDADKELDVFKQKLLNPRDGLKTRFLEGYSEVLVQEVVRRGIGRIPPADTNGQQLRDVILWLMTIAYCEECEERVVLISDDPDFRLSREKGIGLHPSLIGELEQLKLENCEFYEGIDYFLKAYSSPSGSVVPESVDGLVSREQLLKLFEERISTQACACWHGEMTATVMETQLEFVDGTIYDVGRTSQQYCELDFVGSARVRVDDWPYPPPEARYPPEEAKIVRMNQRPVRTEEYDVKAAMRVSVRLVDKRVTDFHVESFRMSRIDLP